MTQRQRRRPPVRPGQRRPAPRKKPRWPRALRRLLPLPIIALMVWLILFNFVFLIRDVEVVGARSLTPQDVVRLSGIRLGSRMGSANLELIRSGVESSGTLALVDVQKRYPSTLVLTVRERTRDAVTLQAGKILVLDSDGYVVSAGDSMPAESVPYVTGLKPSTYRIGMRLNAADAALDAMKIVLETMKSLGVTGYASEISVEDVKAIVIFTRKGTTVLLGDTEHMTAKITWMARALEDLESRGESLGRLDVSSGRRGDFLPGATATPRPRTTQNAFDLSTPTPEPTPEPTAEAEGEAVIGEDAI